MLKGCPVIKILTRPFRFEKSSSDLRNAPSDTPGSCFWRMSQNKKSSLSKTYVISLILPGQKPDWMMTTGSEVQSIFPTLEALISSMVYIKPTWNFEIYTVQLYSLLRRANWLLHIVSQTYSMQKYFFKFHAINITGMSHENTYQSIPRRETTMQWVLGRIQSGSQFPPHVVQQRSLRGRLLARKEGDEIRLT